MPITISGSTGIAGVDGSAASPAIEGSDTNTGIFFPAADTIAFAEGGVEVLRINSSAQVEFQAGTSSLPTVTASGDLNTGMFFPAADTIAFTNGGTEEFRFGPLGQLGVAGANYGTSGQVLTSGGSGASPSWAAANSITLLGTITTTSGTSLSLSGLTLTGYSFLLLFVNGVSSSSATDDLSIVDGASNVILLFNDSNSATNVWNGTVWVNLNNGSIGAWGSSNGTTTYNTNPSSQASASAGAKLAFGRINQTTASTSIGVSVQTAFDAGTVTVYGVR
jgi:hypothetical protein